MIQVLLLAFPCANVEREKEKMCDVCVGMCVCVCIYVCMCDVVSDAVM